MDFHVEIRMHGPSILRAPFEVVKSTKLSGSWKGIGDVGSFKDIYTYTDRRI